MQPDQLKVLRSGVNLEDGLTAPAAVRLMDCNEQADWSKVKITIHEGRNRQVRRMFAAVGHEVMALKRIGFAGLTLTGVPRGNYRELTVDEVARLKEIAGKPGKQYE